MLNRKSFLAVLSLAAGALAFSGIASDASAQPAAAGYRWEINKAANIKFEIPTAWITSTEGESLVTKPKDGGLLFEFVAIDGGQADAKQAEKEILKRMPDARHTDPTRPVAQNGLTGVLIKGEGTRKGTLVKSEFFAIMVGDGKNQPLLSVGYANVGQIGKHREHVVEIFNSIRPAK